MNRYYLIIILMVGIIYSIGYNQVIVPKSDLLINVDFSRFQYAEGYGCLETAFVIYPSTLTMIKNVDTLSGELLIYITLRDIQKDSIILSAPFSFPVQITDTLTGSLHSNFIGKKKINIPYGDYNISIRFVDAKNRYRADSIIAHINLESYPASTQISDIVICSRISESQDNKSPFFRNSYEVITNPSLVYDIVQSPVLFSYAEFYNLEPGTIYRIQSKIIDNKRSIIKQKSREKIYRVNNVVDVNTLSLRSLPSGKYQYQLILTDTLGKHLAHREKMFYVYNPLDTLISDFSSKMNSAVYTGMSNIELENEFEIARYLASPAEIKVFTKLSTSEAMKEFLSTFWTDIEQGKKGVQNITRSIFLERVRIVEQQYRVMGRKGWSTDRGRVYLLYGKPSDIQRFPSSKGSKPYEIWNYYQIENGVEFVFLDRIGFGEYSLIHSTKSGELRDDNWEHNLR